jgi:hypothetical protein
VNGIYQEPLERVLEYMGMSMNIDQVVNTGIDGDIKRRALIPANVLEANHWHEQYTWAVRVREMEEERLAIARQLEEGRLAMEATRQARRADGGY